MKTITANSGKSSIRYSRLIKSMGLGLVDCNQSMDFRLNLSQYGIFFASAGHAALIDYPYAKGLQRIVTEIWTQGGIVSSV